MGLRTLTILAMAVLGVSTGGCSQAQHAFGNRDFSFDPTTNYKEVDLAVLVKNPNAAPEVEFSAIFRQHDEVVWAPHFTVFVPEDYASFSVWPKDARLWEVGGRLGYVATLYIHKTYHPSFPAYLGLKKYERVLIRGKVRSDFENRPWIEVLELEASGELIYTDDALSSMLAGLRDAEEKNHGSAIRHLEKALKGPLGDVAQVTVALKLGWLYEFRAATTRKMEDWKKALDFYRRALNIDESNGPATQGVSRCEAAISRGGIGTAPALAPGTSAPSSKATESKIQEDWRQRFEAERAARLKAEADARTAMDIQAAVEVEKSKALADAASARTVAEQALAEANEAKAKIEADLDALRKQLTAKEEELAKLTAERDELKKRLDSQPQPAEGDEATKKQLVEKDEDIRRIKDSFEMQKHVIQNLREENEKLFKENEELRKKLEEKK